MFKGMLLTVFSVGTSNEWVRLDLRELVLHVVRVHGTNLLASRSPKNFDDLDSTRRLHTVSMDKVQYQRMRYNQDWAGSNAKSSRVEIAKDCVAIRDI